MTPSQGNNEIEVPEEAVEALAEMLARDSGWDDLSDAAIARSCRSQATRYLSAALPAFEAALRERVLSDRPTETFLAFLAARGWNTEFGGPEVNLALKAALDAALSGDEEGDRG